MVITAKTRYVIRVPFHDADAYCFLIDKAGEIKYYNNKDDADQEASLWTDSLVMEIKYNGWI